MSAPEAGAPGWLLKHRQASSPMASQSSKCSLHARGQVIWTRPFMTSVPKIAILFGRRNGKF